MLCCFRQCKQYPSLLCLETILQPHSTDTLLSARIEPMPCSTRRSASLSLTSNCDTRRIVLHQSELRPNSASTEQPQLGATQVTAMHRQMKMGIPSIPAPQQTENAFAWACSQNGVPITSLQFPNRTPADSGTASAAHSLFD